MLDVSVKHRFNDFALNAEFKAPSGVTALFGQSGSGKTTIVNAMAGLLRPDHGHARIGNTTLFDTRTGDWQPPNRRCVGYVFQEGRLFPHMSVRQNLTFGRWFANRSDKGMQFEHAVELLGIADLLDRRPGALSGGEKQRVSIGRALLSCPRLLLMDEPLAALDEPRKAEILPYLERLRDEAAIPILYVSHSVAEVARLATTVVVLRDGRAVECGPATDILSDPEIAPALGVRRAGALLSGRVIRQHEDGLTELRLSNGTIFLPRVPVDIGTELRVRIAAQDVLLSREKPRGLSALNILEVDVLAVKRGQGPGVMVQLAAGQEKLLARITRRSADTLGITVGARCYAVVKTVSVAPYDISETERSTERFDR